jgi:hypothetical protein
MLPSRQLAVDVARAEVALDLAPRIGVQPPYVALYDMALAGLEFKATAVAESPAGLERGPMPAAELGRHAAITGLCHAAAEQDDDRRRYYLARRAACLYEPNGAPYGAPVRFTSRVSELTKRACTVAVRAETTAGPLATFEIDYTILTDAAFRRLFRSRERPTPPVESPYGRLLSTDARVEGQTVEQHIEEIPVSACAGHFDRYPALPVAVLMGQLSYLAGQLVSDPPRPYRVTRGDVEAEDLAWAGESVTFRVRRDGTWRDEAGTEGLRMACEAIADDRSVGGMTLWLTPTGDVS